MKEKILGFIRSFTGNVSKSDAELDLETSLEGIRSVIEIYSQTGGVEGFNKASRGETQSLIKGFYLGLEDSRFQVKLTIDHNFYVDMGRILNNVLVNGEMVKKELSKIRSSIISMNAISAKTANLVRASSHYYFILKYSNELLNYILAKETESISKKKPNIPKKQIEMLSSNMMVFTILLKVYGDKPELFSTKIKMLSDDILTKEENERVDNVNGTGILDLAPAVGAGFIGSPILGIRTMIAKWQTTRYHEMKDTRALLQMRLLHFQQLLANGNVDATVEKEIEYLQDSLTNINIEIERMEASVM